MFINSKKLEPAYSTETPVCIIGGGIAGISLALELSKAGIDCCVLESGGFTSDAATMDLNRGESIGVPYSFADGHRSRYLGGSSNCWGGWCAPFDELDFEKREWISNSGWPFDLSHLLPFYKRSHNVLKLGDYDYDPVSWQKSINREDVKTFSLAGNKVVEKISQFSPPARFGSLYREHLERSKSIRVFLHANVTNIEATEDGNAISHVTVKTFAGNNFSILAKAFVLATGGIENARLLLSSNNVHKTGLGNSNDLVGRYFMDHPRLLGGSLKFSDKWAKNRLYDMKFNWHSPKVSAKGISIAGQLGLSRDVQKAERLSNARVCFFSSFRGEAAKGPMALLRYKDALIKKHREGLKPAKDLMAIVASPLDVTSFVLTRFVKPRFLINDVKFQIIIEQEPTPDNRVMIGREKDKLGVPRVVVDWKPGQQERRTFQRTLELIAEELQSNKIIKQAALHPSLASDSWPENLTGTWHHMGTTRMHDSPKEGVVDRNCCVHGIPNLFVAGSSVFPTSGGNFPTITLTALALRLSDHLLETIVKKQGS